VEVNDYGQITLSELEALDLLYCGNLTTLDTVFFKDEELVKLFNNSIDQNADSIPHISTIRTPAVPLEEFDKENQKKWFMPNDYCPDLLAFLYDQCVTPEQTTRVYQELELFTQHNMIDLLYYLKYLVDTLRENNIVWGVGRGSSVSSYILFLIGVHKIDSLKYNLDIKEFLK
jgi:DNA polymerase III alpha subunit